MREGEGRDDGFVDQLEANDSDKRDGEVILLILGGSFDESVNALRRDTGYDWENNGEES